MATACAIQRLDNAIVLCHGQALAVQSRLYHAPTFAVGMVCAHMHLDIVLATLLGVVLIVPFPALIAQISAVVMEDVMWRLLHAFANPHGEVLIAPFRLRGAHLDALGMVDANNQLESATATTDSMDLHVTVVDYTREEKQGTMVPVYATRPGQENIANGQP